MFTYERLLRTEANLDLLEAFSDCRFDLAPGTGDRADLMVRPVPIGPPLRGWAGYAISALRGLPYQELHLDLYNLGKHATNVISLWRWDAQKRRIGIEVSGPMHLWRYRLGIDGREENWDLRGTYFRAGEVSGLGLRRLGASAALTRDLTARLKWTVGLDIAVRAFRGADDSAFFARGWSAEVRNRFDYLLVDWPERRLQVDSWAELRTGRMLTRFPSRLVGLESGARAHWKPMARAEKYSVAAEMRSGILFGNATLDELFTLGMERDNDLWLRGHVGTRDGRKGSAPMGRQYLLSRNELNRQIAQLPFLRLEVAPFFDWGRTADRSGQFGSRGWLYDTGAQARITSFGGLEFLAVYGRSLRDGTGVFYTAVRRREGRFRRR